MPVKYTESGVDHYGNALPDDICAYVPEDSDEIAGYRVRWRQEDENGIGSRPSKSFSARKFGSLDKALASACEFLEEARISVKVDGAVFRPGADSALTPNDLLPEWAEKHGPEVSEEYAEKLIKCWSRNIEHRPVARTRLVRISADPGILTRFQDELVAEHIKTSKRYEILKDFRAVMRWGRFRHPGALTVELNGLIKLPSLKRSRLAYAADAVGLERIIEAVLDRPARDDLLPLRDAALVAAMGFTVATRPSEWRMSATWEDLHPPSTPDGGFGSIELQRALDSDPDLDEGLKTGAHAALMLPNAYERVATYREALEDRFGVQPSNGLVFQVIGAEGPVWVESDKGVMVPAAWTKNNYNQWVRRVFKPARDVAVLAPDSPAGLGRMTFYDCRHTAISLVLHSTLVIGPHGMNLHPLAGWSGHDVATLQKYYSHLIARYLGKPAIDLLEECARARKAVGASPFKVEESPGPQREEQRRRRQRTTSARSQRGPSVDDPELLAA